MKSYFKKTLLITMLCIHNHSIYSSQNSDNSLNNNITKSMVGLASLIVFASLYEVGTIYFKKHLNQSYGIQTTPDIPTVQVEQRIITDTTFNPYKKDNRSKKLQNPNLYRDYDKMIFPNGQITSRWMYTHKPMMIFYDKLGLADGTATKTQQSRRLNENVKFNSLPKIPTPVGSTDLTNYLNYDLK